jgi:peptidyl-prolyl cis-trans isomerase A (cyclophilin A)
MTTVRFSTALGIFDITLNDDAAPSTVKNFLRYVRAGAYDDGRFARVVTPETSGNSLLPLHDAAESDGLPNGDVPINVLQGGASAGWQDFAPIPIETTAMTGLHHLDGTISMGRRGPDTATSAFFICLGDQPQLGYGGARNPDGHGFAAFGRVSVGMEVIRAIHSAPADGQELTPPVTIHSASVIE